MATLTETAYYTRRGFVFLAIAAVVFLALRFFLILAFDIYRQKQPPELPKPTVDFGRLPGVMFIKDQPTPPLTFRLETKEGGLPQATPSAVVYFIPRQSPSLLAADRARVFAKQLGFEGEPVSKTATFFQFTDMVEKKTLFLDIITNNFKLLQLPPIDENLGTPPLDVNEAIRQSGNFFSNLRMLPETIDEQLTKTQLLRKEADELIEATSLSNAQAIRVDFFEGAINSIPIVTPYFNRSQIYTLYTGKDRRNPIIEAGFKFFKVDTTVSGSYPLKTPQQAWEELKQGLAYVASMDKAQQEIIIRRVYLAYYQAPEYQPYLHPVFVFAGDNQFAAYVSAIDTQWADQPQYISVDELSLNSAGNFP